MQFIPDIPAGGYENACRRCSRLPPTRAAGHLLADPGSGGDAVWTSAINLIEVQLGGRGHHPQVYPRPIGLVIGLELTANPFVLYPGYQEIADLPLAQRVAGCASRGAGGSGRYPG